MLEPNVDLCWSHTCCCVISYSATPENWTATNTYWVQLSDGAGFTKKFTWEYGSVKEEVTRGGTNVLENFYSVSFAGSRGRVLTGISKSGVQQQFQYNAQGRVTNRIDRLGGTWQQGYNSQNRKTSVTDPQGNATTFVYDSNGIDLLYEVPPVGPIQNVVSCVPGKHAIATESNALGNVVWCEYNALGLVTNVNDGRTVETFSYDAEGRLTARHRNGVLIETNQYDGFGRLEWSRDAAGLEITRTYDALNNRTAIQVDGETVESAAFDALGRLLSSVNADGLSVTNTWDSWGELNSRNWPGGLQESFQYGDRGLTNAIDRLSIVSPGRKRQWA